MKKGPEQYVYYRCTRYTRLDHPRLRVREAALDVQVLALFDRIRIEDEKVRDWFGRVLWAKARGQQDTRRNASRTSTVS